MCRISVIIPVYNVENYLERCLNSIIKQITIHDEIILVDDCSTDSSGEICKNYENNYENIHYYKQEKNSGPSRTRNLGLEKAQGKYITFLDSDDFVEDNYMDTMLTYMDHNDLVICGYVLNDESKHEKKMVKMTSQKMNRKSLINLLENNEMLNTLWNKMYRTEIIKNNNIKFDEEESRGEDLLFNLDYILYAKGGIYIIDKLLYHYIMRQRGLNQGLKESFTSRMKRARKVSKKMKRINNSFKVKKIVFRNYLLHMYLYLKDKVK